MELNPVASMQVLSANLDRLGPRDRAFADSLIDQWSRRGSLSAKQWPWIETLAVRATAPPPAAQPVGDLKGVLAMFRTAAANLKFPAIVLGGGEGQPAAFRVYVAGERASFPGTLTVTATARDASGRRPWLGRVMLDGTYQPSRSADAAAVGAMLQRFAQDPEKVAAEHGRLTGRCCFCNRALKDARSTAVGYGPDCAKAYGRAWGCQ